MTSRCAVAAVITSVAAFFAAAAPAFATVTTSTVTVTSPAGTYLLDDEVTPQNTITVTGTSDGTSTDAVDLNCYAGTGYETLATDVAVASEGSFTFTGSFKSIADETCVLRAVPTGDGTDYPPGMPSAFTGPTLAISQVEDNDISGGPNNGDLEAYYLDDSQLSGGFDYDSLGGCTIDDSYTYDPVTFASATLDYCNAFFWYENGATGAGVAPPTRSELQVDGADAYLAGDIDDLGLPGDDLSGFPSESYSYSIDPTTGNLVLNEVDQVVKCSPGGVFPPTSTSCTSFVPTGVQVTMHIVQGDNGRIATVTQYFSSTDGQTHSVDLLEENDFYAPNDDGELDFPWTGSGMQPYTTAGQVIPGPTTAGPGSFYIKGSASVPDGSEASAEGAVTYSNPPDSVTIVGTTNSSNGASWIELHYARTVPATGSVALAFTYSNAFLLSEVTSDSAAAAAAFLPSVAIASPVNGSTTVLGAVTVSGAAADANGLSSLTVDGKAVSVASNGTWSTAVPLSAGANTITAVATNVFGYTAQAQTTVNYVPPAPTPTVPTITHASQSHSKWRESGRAGKHKPPVGTSFSFTLNESARVTLTFTERVGGRRVKKNKCVTQTHANRHKPSCKLTVKAGTLTVTGRSGLNKLSFKGAVAHGHKLKTGTYTVTITATNTTTHKTSAPVRLKFTIVK